MWTLSKSLLLCRSKRDETGTCSCTHPGTTDQRTGPFWHGKRKCSNKMSIRIGTTNNKIVAFILGLKGILRGDSSAMQCNCRNPLLPLLFFPLPPPLLAISLFPVSQPVFFPPFILSRSFGRHLATASYFHGTFLSGKCTLELEHTALQQVHSNPVWFPLSFHKRKMNKISNCMNGTEVQTNKQKEGGVLCSLKDTKTTGQKKERNELMRINERARVSVQVWNRGGRDVASILCFSCQEPMRVSFIGEIAFLVDVLFW